MKIKGQIVDIHNKTIYKGELVVEGGKIKAIIKKDHQVTDFIMPGFISGTRLHRR